MNLKIVSLAAAVTALVAVPAAWAHVTINPNTAAAGSFARFDLRVPNEDRPQPSAAPTSAIPNARWSTPGPCHRS